MLLVLVHKYEFYLHEIDISKAVDKTIVETDKMALEEKYSW